MNSWAIYKLESSWSHARTPSMLAKHFLDSLWFHPKNVLARKVDENILLFSAESVDPLELGLRLYQNKRMIIAISGLPFHLKNGILLSAKSLAQELERVPLDELSKVFGGEFSIGIYERLNRKLSGYSSLPGTQPLFYYSNSDIFALSNNQRLLAKTCQRENDTEFDLLSAASLIAQGNKFGDRSIFSEVNIASPNFLISNGANGKANISQQSAKLYAQKDEIISADYDDACDALIQNFDWIGSIKSLSGKKIPLSLTGGADSRLMLAIALQSKLADQVTTFTFGGANHPDVQLAKIVANTAGVDHFEPTPAGGSNISDTTGDHEMSSFWSLMKKRAWLYSAQQGAFDGTRASRLDHSVDITGLYSETFRRVRPENAGVDILNLEQAFQSLHAFQQPHDPYGILTKPAEEDLKDSVMNFIDVHMSDGASFNEIPELYYATNRLPWWAGSINMVSSSTRLAPLASLRATQIALAQSLYDKSNGRFFIEVMKRLAPNLMELPLVGKTYSSEYISKTDKIKLATAPYLPTKQPTTTSPQKQTNRGQKPSNNYTRPIPWQVAFVKYHPEVLSDYLLSDKSCSIFELVDFNRLKAVLSSLAQIDNHAKIKSILSLVELAMLVKGDSISDKVNSNYEPKSFKINSNLEEFHKISNTNDWSIPQDPNPLMMSSASSSSNKDVLTIEGNMPLGVKLGRLRIDPFGKHGSSIRLLSVRLIEKGQGRFKSIPFERLLISPNISTVYEPDGTIVLKYLGANPQIVFRFSDLGFDFEDPGRLQIRFQPIFGNDILTVFFDCGNGFTRSQMYSLIYAI